MHDLEQIDQTVFVRDGKVFTNSREVTAIFKKEPKHVHEAIKNLIAKSPDDLAPNFRPIYINDLTGASIASYDMTKDGFAILVMGFTGEDALKFKIAYISRFNAMEEALKATPQIDFRNPDHLLPLLTAYAEDKKRLTAELAVKTAKVAKLEPKANILDAIVGEDGWLTIAQLAKNLDQGPRKLRDRMIAAKMIYERNGETYAHQTMVNRKLLKHRIVPYYVRSKSAGGIMVEKHRQEVLCSFEALAVIAKKLGLDAPKQGKML